MDKIQNFIEYLSLIRTNENAENLYSGNSVESEIRRHNLRIYLTLMQKISPSILLVGEAPGYKGCKLTGIPFTSEDILLSKNHGGILGKQNGYKTINPENRLQNETSASIVWNELSSYKKYPVMWNIFPFHPFVLSDSNSNRCPNANEIELGKKILLEFIALFNITKIGAVGRRAEYGIKNLQLDIENQYIRHPSHGGTKLFKEHCFNLFQSKK